MYEYGNQTSLAFSQCKRFPAYVLAGDLPVFNANQRLPTNTYAELFYKRFHIHYKSKKIQQKAG